MESCSRNSCKIAAHGQPSQGFQTEGELDVETYERASSGGSARPWLGTYPVAALIDLHSHILPGLDDGARTIDESRDMARIASREGVTMITATPHVRDDFPTTAEQMERAVDELNKDFAQEQIDVAVLHGGEIDLEWLNTMAEEEIERFSLAQTGRYLLVEVPLIGWPLYLDSRVFELRSANITPLLAHPERNREVQRNPAILDAATRAGALVQVTAASLDGRLGRRVKQACEHLLEFELVHVLATDAHAPAIRAAGLSEAVAALRDEGLARYLTQEVPAAIIAGESIPQRGAGKRGGRRRF
jgi:protein-tyrosine phosphatase